MRRQIINLAVCVALMLAWAAPARGETVTVVWNASPSANVAGYRIYWGMSSRVYCCMTNAGLVLTQAVVLPQSGRWFFAATAYDTSGLESAWSNEVEWESKPVAPTLHGEAIVRLTPVIERSTNLVHWVSIPGAATYIEATNAAEFFRTRRLVIEQVQRALDQ